MYILYSLALGLTLLLSLPWWLLQMLRHDKYRAGIGERLGRVPRRILRPYISPPRISKTGANSASPVIWVHAVSVGEVLAISGLVKELRRHLPGHRIVVSTTTSTGQKLARERFGEAEVFYFPLDFTFVIRRYMRALRPEMVILAETEFWPNFLRLARQYGARIAVVNARISDRSFPRYRRLRSLMTEVVGAINVFLAQTEEDARRLLAIGAPPERVQVSGNLKFDMQPPAEPAVVAALRNSLARANAGPILVFGSTVEGEEPLVLAAFRKLLAQFPRAVLVLAPRHPERFAAVAELVRQSELRFWRRSQWNLAEPPTGGVFLLDSIGELGAMYALADVAFVGGSLVARGGHNILEPAFFGAPVLVGPHTENFRDIVATFQARQAVLVVKDGDDLTATLPALLSDDKRRRQLGENASVVMKANAGATERTLIELEKLLAAGGNRVPVVLSHFQEPSTVVRPQGTAGPR